jgi:hypothetical protein
MRMTFCSEAGTARQRGKTVAQDSQGPFTFSSISLNKLTLRFQGWHKAAKLKPKVKRLAVKKEKRLSSLESPSHTVRRYKMPESGTARERVKTVAQDSRGQFTFSSISLSLKSGG